MMSAQAHIQSIRDDWLLHPISTAHSALERMLSRACEDLYPKDGHLIQEHVQNADDNTYHRDVVPTLRMCLTDTTFVTSSNEGGFSEEDMKALCSVHESRKAERKADGLTGEKGIGFKSSFKVANVVHVASNGYRVKFDRRNHLGMVCPEWDDDAPSVDGETVFAMDLLPGAASTLAKELRDFSSSTLFFLRRLREIKIEIRTSNSPESFSVSYTRHCGDTQTIGLDPVRIDCNEAGLPLTNITCLMHRLSIRMAHIDEPKRRGIETTEVVIGFPVNSDGSPVISRQPVFASQPMKSAGLSFIVHGDFLTTTNRREVLQDPDWNRRIRDEISSGVSEAVEALLAHESLLRYAWPLYLSNEVIDPFFRPVMDRTVDALRRKRVVLDEMQVPRMASQVFALPTQYCFGGSPLIPSQFLGGRRYLHPDYSNVTGNPIAILQQQLSLRAMRDVHYIDGLCAMSRRNQFPSRTPGWHRAAASQLLHIYDRNDFLRARIRCLPIIPLADGRTWTSMTGGVFFPVEDTSIPSHLRIPIVHTDAASDPERRRLLKMMGVCDLTMEHVVALLLSNQEGLRETDYVSNARFFYALRNKDQPPDVSSLRFAVETGEALLGSQVYLAEAHRHSGKCLRDELSRLNRPPHFITPSYLSSDDPPTWRKWLVDVGKIRTEPDRADIPALFRDRQLSCILRILRRFYRGSDNKDKWKSAVQRVSLEAGHGRPFRFKDLCLRRGKLRLIDENIGLRFVPVTSPDNTRWDFLTDFGVSTTLDPDLSLRLLTLLSQSNNTTVPLAQITEYYELINARIRNNPTFGDCVREAFASERLVFIPADDCNGREARWRSIQDDLLWRGPKSSVLYTSLSNFYPSALSDLFASVGIPETSPTQVIDELRRLSEDYAGRVLDERTRLAVHALLNDVFTTSLQEPNPDPTLREFISTVAIFPAEVHDGGQTITNRLYRLADVYVAGRNARFTAAFRRYVALMAAFPNDEGTLSRFLASSVCSGLVRRLDDCVRAEYTASDPVDIDSELQENLQLRYRFIEQEVIRTATDNGRHPERELSTKQSCILSQLKTVTVLRVDRIDVKWTLGNETVHETESVWIENLPPHTRGPHLNIYLLQRTSDVRREEDLQARLCGEIARQLSIQLRDILSIVHTPLPSLELQERLARYGDGVSSTVREPLRPIPPPPPTNFSLTSPRQSALSLAPSRANAPNDFLTQASQLILSGATFTPSPDTGLVLDVHRSRSTAHVSAPTSSLGTPHRSPAKGSSRITTSTTQRSPSKQATPRSSGGIVGSSPTSYQQVNGVLGETVVFEIVSRIIGREAAVECWTSELRGKTGQPEYIPDGEVFGDFTIKNRAWAERFGRQLFKDVPELLGPCIRSGNWPRIYLEVKSTSSPRAAGTSVHLRARQLEIARRMHISASIEPPQDVFVLVRVWDVRKLSLENVKFYIDPFQSILNGELRFTSDDIEMMLAEDDSA
ncbi:unnamed protein product [Peniophora sp. CBMAI 1063]|nr:unnamed protein product [Peniophora sp. CBMAI 1063]